MITIALDQNFLRELHEKADIEAIVSPYVQLKRRGKNLVGLCPFHNEKTPSFNLYPETQSFYCFGCGAGGDAVTFIRRIENLDFTEAVKSVAASVGMKMPEDGFDDTLAKKRQRILAANREAARYFNSCLRSPGGETALNYFYNRGLTDSSITRFGLGYAPDSWDSLLTHLKSLGFSEQELVESDLAKRSAKSGRAYDNFRNRIVFPLIDLRGNVIAFSCRVLDDSKPKYVNTSDTLVYKKGRDAFGLNFAKNGNQGKLILVEGNMDVVSLHQAGFTNTIACLGTALTTEQANLLSRYADEIFLCYDSDEAGQKATKRNLEILGKTGVKTRVVNLTGGKDPDEIIKTYGKERFNDLLNGASNKIEYALLRERERFNVLTDDGRMNYINACCDVLASAGEIERDIYAGRLSSETGVSKDAIITRVRSRARTLHNREAQEKQQWQFNMLTDMTDKNNPERSKNIGAARAEEILIASLVRNPDFYNKLCSSLDEALFVTAFNRRVFAFLLNLLSMGETPTIGSFSAEFDPSEMDSISRICMQGTQISNTLKECEDCIEKLKNSAPSEKTDISSLSDEEYLKLFKKKS